MQNYEQTTRIRRAPVIIPPAGAAAVQETEEPLIEEETADESAALDLFRAPVFRTAARKTTGAERLLMVQSVLCGLALASLLFLRASSPAVFEAVRNWYTEEIGRVITVQVEAAGETE